MTLVEENKPSQHVAPRRLLPGVGAFFSALVSAIQMSRTCDTLVARGMSGEALHDELLRQLRTA